jgi:hypothetical protein
MNEFKKLKFYYHKFSNEQKINKQRFITDQKTN